MGDDGDEVVSVRLSSQVLDWLDEQADAAGVERSDALRRNLEFVRASQKSPDVERETALEGEISAIISENQEVRKLLPSKWRAHLQSLFVDDLADDVSPSDLEIMAEGYRRQARKKMELAREKPRVPDADLVGIVDEELRRAMEAADLSNYYEAVDNPHERHLSGVAEGKEERDEFVTLVANLVNQHASLAATYDKPGNVVQFDPDNLGAYAPSLFPEGVDRQDVARLVTKLTRMGLDGDDVEDAIPTVDPSLGIEEIEGEVDGAGDQLLDDEADPDVEEATLRMGGQVINEEEQTDAEDSQPLTEPASETAIEAKAKAEQQRLATLPAADGGRNPDTVGVEVDTDMTENNPNSDDSTDSESPDFSDEVEEIAQEATAAIEEDQDDE